MNRHPAPFAELERMLLVIAFALELGAVALYIAREVYAL